MDFGAPEPFGLDSAEATVSFLLRLRASGVRDLGVLRAMEAVPRAVFVPHRYVDLAARDIALPIGCGQTMSEPGVVARVLEALACGPGHRVLEVGSGSGYVTALLSRLAREVVGTDRFQALATEAQVRLSGLGVANAAVAWEDGLSPGVAAGGFDRIVLHAAVDAVPPTVLEVLNEGGVIVYPAPARGAPQAMVRATRRGDGALATNPLFACRVQPAASGRSMLL